MAKKNYKTLLKTITTLIFDVDGVLTDSSLLVNTNGDLLRKMHTRDGYALRAAVDAGLNYASFLEEKMKVFAND